MCNTSDRAGGGLRLSRASYNWAIKHLTAEGDSDLFPRPAELAALKYHWDHGVADDLATLDLENYTWRGGRRLLVPKGNLAFRHGTQMDPVDSLVLAAFMRRIGSKLEAHRVALDQGNVYSYRFSPTADGRFYGADTRWNQFWGASCERASDASCTHVLVADVVDFYNQIYHHVVENQLREAGLTTAEQTVLRRFMKAYSETVSRGIPVGPHSVHLLAELSLDPIDRELLGMGYDFCRYVDDFHVFCHSEDQAVGALYDLANCLDAQQRLGLARRKTEILTADDFIELASRMLDDNPTNALEEDLLEIIGEYVGDDDRYAVVRLEDLPDEVLEQLSDELLSDLLDSYLSEDNVNYSRVGWLLRRLRQVGAPGAIDYLVDNMEDFAPVLGDVARYLMASADNYEGDAVQLGGRITEQFGLPAVARSPYVQIVLLDVLASTPVLNHANEVTARYSTSDPATHREILRVAATGGLGAWLRGRKQEFRAMDPWTRIGYLLAVPLLPGDEGIHWLREIRSTLTPLERLVVKYSYRDRAMRLGTTQIR